VPAGAIPRKDSITMPGQDRTIKNHKTVIFHIFGDKLPIKLLQRNLAQG